MKKQPRVSEETLIEATKTYKRVKKLNRDVSYNAAAEEILLQYIEENREDGK